MIANFFQSLSDHRVEHLLISGQASILYGAATFSEDIDLWLDPTAENCSRFVSALRDCRARYYKFTPPLTPCLLRWPFAVSFPNAHRRNRRLISVRGPGQRP